MKPLEPRAELYRKQSSHRDIIRNEIRHFLSWAKDLNEDFYFMSSNESRSRILYILLFKNGSSIALDIDCLLPELGVCRQDRIDRDDLHKRLFNLGHPVVTVILGKRRGSAADHLTPILRKCGVRGLN